MAMTVSELAKQVGVTPDTVRHYVHIGLVNPQRHQHNRYRLFSEADANCLCFIHLASALGYTLQEIGTIVAEARRGQARCPKTREIIQRRIAPNRQKLNRLTQMQTSLEAALAAWSRRCDGVPSGRAVRQLMLSISPE